MECTNSFGNNRLAFPDLSHTENAFANSTASSHTQYVRTQIDNVILLVAKNFFNNDWSIIQQSYFPNEQIDSLKSRSENLRALQTSGHNFLLNAIFSPHSELSQPPSLVPPSSNQQVQGPALLSIQNQNFIPIPAVESPSSFSSTLIQNNQGQAQSTEIIPRSQADFSSFSSLSTQTDSNHLSFLQEENLPQETVLAASVQQPSSSIPSNPDQSWNKWGWNQQAIDLLTSLIIPKQTMKWKAIQQMYFKKHSVKTLQNKASIIREVYRKATSSKI